MGKHAPEPWVVEIKTPRGSIEVDVEVDTDQPGDNFNRALLLAHARLAAEGEGAEEDKPTLGGGLVTEPGRYDSVEILQNLGTEGRYHIVTVWYCSAKHPEPQRLANWLVRRLGEMKALDEVQAERDEYYKDLLNTQSDLSAEGDISSGLCVELDMLREQLKGINPEAVGELVEALKGMVRTNRSPNYEDIARAREAIAKAEGVGT